MHPRVFQAILRWSIVIIAVTILSGINGCLTIQDEIAEAEYRRMKDVE